MSAPSGFLFENRLAVVLILILVLVIHCKFLQRS